LIVRHLFIVLRKCDLEIPRDRSATVCTKGTPVFLCRDPFQIRRAYDRTLLKALGEYPGLRSENADWQGRFAVT
jgi:hypothetical protein